MKERGTEKLKGNEEEDAQFCASRDSLLLSSVVFLSTDFSSLLFLLLFHRRCRILMFCLFVSLNLGRGISRELTIEKQGGMNWESLSEGDLARTSAPGRESVFLSCTLPIRNMSVNSVEESSVLLCLSVFLSSLFFSSLLFVFLEFGISEVWVFLPFSLAFSFPFLYTPDREHVGEFGGGVFFVFLSFCLLFSFSFLSVFLVIGFPASGFLFLFGFSVLVTLVLRIQRVFGETVLSQGTTRA